MAGLHCIHPVLTCRSRKPGRIYSISEAANRNQKTAFPIFIDMEYRGIEYTFVQGIERGVWKWSASVAVNASISLPLTRSAAASPKVAGMPGVESPVASWVIVGRQHLGYSDWRLRGTGPISGRRATASGSRGILGGPTSTDWVSSRARPVPTANQARAYW
jgi:hypothetical protein